MVGLTADEEILTRFSLKEALYKAMHPTVCQYIGLRDVEVDPTNCGSALIQFNARDHTNKSSTSLSYKGKRYSYKASWIKYQDTYCISAVQVRPDVIFS